MRINEKIQKTRETPYQKVARECGVSISYVKKIAQAVRNPKRGVGVAVLEKLNQIIAEHN